MEKLKIMSVFGTRPEAIKMAPLVKQLEKTPEVESIVCVTAQHREMLDQVLEIFDLHPQYDLNIMEPKQTLATITTKALNGLSQVMAEVKPDLVLVHGDTTTTFAGALGAFYNQIPVGHVEAGLRTYDKYQPFPEELNRCLTSQLTELHFAPTLLAKEHLLKENIKKERIFITGNTVIDALQTTIEEEYTFTVDTLNHIDFQNKRIIAMTAHRRENLGEPLEQICRAVKRIVEDHADVEVVYAVHKNPAVSEPVHKILGGNPRIHLLDPLDLKDMHNLMCRSYFVMTDSGGLQEEVPSMGKPVLVLRNVTERPEGIEAGTLALAGTEENRIYELAYTLLHHQEVYEQMAKAKNPFGDGNASRRIVESILYYFGKQKERPKDYIVAKTKQQKVGGDPMKEERMTILRMLEKGMITAEEAEKLLYALHGTKKLEERDGVSDMVNGALNKAGGALNAFAKTLGKQAEKLEPKVKDVAEKVTEKASEFAEDAKTYAEKLREKRAKAKEEDDIDWEDDDVSMEESDEEGTPEQTEPVSETEEKDEPSDYLKNLDSYMDSMQMQLQQIDDAENFLKSAFGEDTSWEDEETTEEKKEDKEQ